MTPKEKCDSLHTDYLKVLGVQRLDYHKKILYNIAKECALIAMEEIIIYYPISPIATKEETIMLNYLLDVKKEIENL